MDEQIYLVKDYPLLKFVDLLRKNKYFIYKTIQTNNKSQNSTTTLKLAVALKGLHIRMQKMLQNMDVDLLNVSAAEDHLRSIPNYDQKLEFLIQNSNFIKFNKRYDFFREFLKDVRDRF